MIQQCAKTIVDDEDATDYVVFEGDDWNCLDQLRQQSTIDGVVFEEDPPVEAFFGEEAWSTSSSSSHRSLLSSTSRLLSETVPWGIHAIQADQLSAGPNNVTVCVIDTGIASGHPDFHMDRVTGKTRMMSTMGSWDADRSGHGTHVAGTIAAASGNGMGIQGGGNFDLYIVRALGDNARGYESDVYMALEACIDHGAHVINLSLGSPVMTAFTSELYTRAVEEHGIIIVAAAGNNGDDTRNFPASHPSVISVGGTYDYGKRFHSSVFNDQIEFVAPGHNILSTSVSADALQTLNFGYPAKPVAGTPDKSKMQTLVYCDYGRICSAAEGGKICLANVRNDGSVDLVLTDCQRGGGSGAVIFNSDEGANTVPSLKLRYTSSIPAIAISRSAGLDLIAKLDDDADPDGQRWNWVRIGNDNTDSVEYTYEVLSGTSFAAPHVAAAAALLKSHFFTCTNYQIRYALAKSAKGGGECNTEYGYGMIQVKDAYDWLLEQGDCGEWDLDGISHGGCSTLDSEVIILEQQEKVERNADESNVVESLEWLVDFFSN